VPTVYDPIANSGCLDFTGYRITDQPNVEAAYGLTSGGAEAAFAGINVALVLGRAQDPTALLAENWAERQQTLAQLGSAGTWATYGADPNQYNAIEQSLSSTLHLTVLDGTNSNYVTSAQSRTVWVELNSAADFNALFGTTLYPYTAPHHQGNDFVFWNGNLSLPEGWNVQGLSVGNGSSLQPALALQDIAALYNFPR
jgi:hypothetical protein